MSLECCWEFEDSALMKSLPVKIVEIQAVLKKLEVRLRKLQEWKDTEKALGYKVSRFALFICSEKTMRSYQKKFRSLKRSTDVLSFPAAESPQGHERGYLGDIVLSLPNVERNARRYDCTFREEFVRVFVHSILHLLGFDHVNVAPRARKRMFDLQEELIQNLSRLVYKKPHERKVARNRR